MTPLLDAKTLLLVLPCVLICKSALLGFIWHQHRTYQPTRWWMLGSASMALGIVLLNLRDVTPLFFSVFLGQTAIMLGVMSIASGTLMAAGHNPPWRAGGGVVLAAMAGTLWFLFVDPDYTMRTWVVGAPSLVFDLYVASVCLRLGGNTRRRSTLRVLAVLMLLAQASAQLKNLHIQHAHVTSPTDPGWEISLYYLVTTLALIAYTVFYVLLAAQHIQEELEMEIEQRKLAERQMQLANLVYQSSDEGVIVTDAEGVIRDVNPAFTRITGFARDAVLGQTPRLLKSARHNTAFHAAIWKALLTHGKWQGEIWNAHPSGQEYAMHMGINTLYGVDGKAELRVALFHDITQQKASTEKIFHQANYDRLTGLNNRYAFFERLANELSRARRAGCGVGLLYMDLNRFKPVNDNYGHEAGDAVLKIVAERWQGSLRATDILARIGGDEFALLMGNASSPDEVERVAQKLVAALDAPIELPSGHKCEIGTSIGIALYPEHGTEMDSLMAAADAAMYSCKADSKARGDTRGGYALSGARSDSSPIRPDWVTFDDSHRVGIPLIDAQHMKLVAMVNAINRAVMQGKGDDDLKRAFSELISYAAAHFDTEHQMMVEHQYPDCAAHDAQHEHLAAQLSEIISRFEPGDELRLLQTTKDWLMGHIVNSDKPMCAFLRSQGM